MIFPSNVKTLLGAGATGLVATGFMSIVFSATAFAQATDESEVEYSNLLNSIAAQKTTLAYQELFVSQQDVQITDLNSQLAGLSDLTATLEPMVGKMATSIAREIRTDYPFEMDRRSPRLASLEASIIDPNASVADKYRKALNVYKLEVNYGQSLEAKKGNHPIPAKQTVRVGDDRYERDKDDNIKISKITGEPVEKTDGTYLRYGRLAYVYLQADSSEALRYDLGAGEWVDLPKNKIADIRRGVKIASGEAAPSVVKVPVFTAP